MSTDPAARPPAWYVISLRPRGDHLSVRRAAAAVGAGVIALSPWRLRQHDDADTRARLGEALAAPRVLFTSPAAVRAAATLQPLRARADQQWLAVGAGTAAALRRCGIGEVVAPARMDSEGLLGLPQLQELPAHARLGLVTAPGGRGVLEPALQARGAQVLRANVYAREPLPPSPRAVARVATLDAPAALLLSSAEALALLLAVLPEAASRRLRSATAVAASQRLAALAREQGFAEVVLAAGPRPRDLVAAAAGSVEARIR